MASAISTHESDIVGEPTLEELFADPIVRLIMARDGVEESDMRGQIDRVRSSYHRLTVAQ